MFFLCLNHHSKKKTKNRNSQLLDQPERVAIKNRERETNKKNNNNNNTK